MRNKSVWQRAFGLARTVVEDVGFDEEAEAVVVSVRPVGEGRGRCGRCGRRSPGYDRGEGRRRWRALDLGTTQVFVEADAPRVRCRAHGPTVARCRGRVTVPATPVTSMIRRRGWRCTSRRARWSSCCGWRGARSGRSLLASSGDIDARVDRLAGLRRIGIDEISYKRGFSYLTVVVDHDSGRLVWAAPGRDDATVAAVLRRARSSNGPPALTHVSADMAPWISRVVEARAPQAVRCADPFHVVAWATDALGRRTAPSLERGVRPTPPQGELDEQRRRTGPDDQTLPVGAVEEPGAPHRAPTPPARLDRQDRPPTCGAPTCSKKDCATSSPSKATTAKRHSTAGSSGPDAADSPPSSSCNDGSSNTAPRSTPPSTPACPTPSSNQPTPRSGCSPASPSASTHPNPSSPSPCSASAATPHPSPAANDPRIQQESPISRRRVTRWDFADVGFRGVR